MGRTDARTPDRGGDAGKYRRNHPHPESPQSRKKSNRKYRISSYGLAQEQFGRLLGAQQYTCGMYHEPFEDGQLKTRGP
jgi:hypothetical protein